MTPTQALWRKVRHEVLAPAQPVTPSDFAQAELVIPTGPRAGMHWDNRFAPYQPAILDAFGPGVEFVAIMASAQGVGKTTIALAKVAHAIVHGRRSVFIVFPTVDPVARDFSKNRLGPLIDASPILRASVATTHARDAHGSTTLLKQVRNGCWIAIGGANSAASLAVRDVPVLILDEIERYPAELEGEGATIEVAIKRTLVYQPHREVLLISSPKWVGGPIHKWFLRGDQRHYYVPCPHCGAMDRIRWSNVRWVDDDPATAHLICATCRGQWGDAGRLASLAKGEWRAEHPERADRRIVSFALWEGYSPLSTLREIVRTFLAARQAQREGDRSLMHTFQNTTLGEPVEPDEGVGVEPHALLLRRESYGADIDAPAGVVAITMGVDLQDDRIEALVVGWGVGEESWLLDRQVLPGDPAQPGVWAMLDELLATEYRHALGVKLPIHAAAVDSGGHKTDFAYDYCRRQAARRVYAVKGVAGERPVVSSPSPRRGGAGERKVDLYLVGVDSAKAVIMSRLALTEKGRGYVHIPQADWADEELAAQLTSERLVTRFTKGIPETVWKQMRPRNEMLDCLCYSYWAVRRLRPPFELWSARITEAAAARSAPAAPAGVEHAGDPADPPPQMPRPAQPAGRRTYRSRYMDQRSLPSRDWRMPR